MSLLKKIFGFLANRWLLSVLGLLLVALLIWLLGPEVAIGGRVPLASEVNRLIAILVAVLVWAALVIVKALRQRRTNQAVVEGLMQQVAQPPEDPSAIASREVPPNDPHTRHRGVDCRVCIGHHTRPTSGYPRRHR